MVLAAARQALGDGCLPRTTRWNHLGQLSRHLMAMPRKRRGKPLIRLWRLLTVWMCTAPRTRSPAERLTLSRGCRLPPERLRPPVDPTEPQQPCGTVPPSVHRFSKTSPETVPDPLFRSPWSMQVGTQCSIYACEMRTEPRGPLIWRVFLVLAAETANAHFRGETAVGSAPAGPVRQIPDTLLPCHDRCG